MGQFCFGWGGVGWGGDSSFGGAWTVQTTKNLGVGGIVFLLQWTDVFKNVEARLKQIAMPWIS